MTHELTCAAAFLSGDTGDVPSCWGKVAGTLAGGAACAAAIAGAVAVWSSGWGIFATYALIKGVQAVCIGSFLMLAATIAACVNGEEEDQQFAIMRLLEQRLKELMAERVLALT